MVKDDGTAQTMAVACAGPTADDGSGVYRDCGQLSAAYLGDQLDLGGDCAGICRLALAAGALD